ncbi:hypothetical protein AGMMS50256_38140 [Betaproteobacteria bacterium]|nr:hypothetical protein AGMMS50256_38140 [Betaproteobacteria bacterium]
MATPIPVARVSAVQGQASAKGENGTLRPLHVGDYLYEGEIVITGANSYVDVTTQDGLALTYGANETVKLDAEVLARITPDTTDSSVNAGGDDFNRIVTALNQGENLDDLLEEPAAGAGGGDAGGGPSFVRLLRIVEGVDPLAYEYSTERGDVLDYPINGGGSDNQADVPVEPDPAIEPPVEPPPVEPPPVEPPPVEPPPVEPPPVEPPPVEPPPVEPPPVEPPPVEPPPVEPPPVEPPPVEPPPVDPDYPPTLIVPDTNGPGVNGNDSVREDLTTTGSFTITAPDGLADDALVIAGTPVSKAALEASGTTNIVINTPQGVLTITGYTPNPATGGGVVHWGYDPGGPNNPLDPSTTSKNHTGPTEVLDTISITVKDVDGDTVTGNLVINILDTAPEARADANSVTEDVVLVATGNVIGGSSAAPTDVADIESADVAPAPSLRVTNITSDNTGMVGSVGTSGLAGQYGTLYPRCLPSRYCQR